ncbi:hypothetical protein HNY73_011202 [Argiope bruennichi]|uniref:Uncharacterized protein n=1 Tax=Argiope bruennichi TaxID=94029 RepID=A0A8T0F8D5_ARGBR|nr:hypothetical protein HNY73_011202 [Argiope bruennichi]
MRKIWGRIEAFSVKTVQTFKFDASNTWRNSIAKKLIHLHILSEMQFFLTENDIGSNFVPFLEDSKIRFFLNNQEK